MGVCKDLSGLNQCNPGSDDNVTIGETLLLSFDQQVTLDSLKLVNGDHYSDFATGAKFSLIVDNILLGNFQLESMMLLGITGKSFEIFNLTNNNDANTEFYIHTMNVSAVPLPAAVWLFGSTLAGFVGFSRFRKKA